LCHANPVIAYAAVIDPEIVENLRAIACGLFVAMHSLKWFVWGLFVGSPLQATPIFALLVGEMHEHTIALQRILKSVFEGRIQLQEKVSEKTKGCLT
jgi:hypothetical protein